MHPAIALNEQELGDLAQRALELARQQGADAAEVAVSRSSGLSVTVRLGEVETVEHNRDKNLVISVYMGRCTGSASTSDFAAESIADSVRAACAIARYTADDPCARLADPERLATRPMDLDLYHPWSLDVARAVDLAAECEGAARHADQRITNSEGATVNSHDGHEVYANSNGFIGANAGSRHSISCAVVGQQDGSMQRDYWYTSHRVPEQLQPAISVGEAAARRTLSRLGARQIKTCRVPVIYEAPVARGLLSHLVGAVRGANLYRRASFLVDHKGEKIFPDWVRIDEKPHLPQGYGSAWFDNDGVATVARDLVAGGVLMDYVLDVYSGCKLGMETTGNAGGVRNLTIEPNAGGLPDLMGQMGKGLLVTELIGHGINMVTGDYSRGAAGYWVENGEIQYPVEEITVAGNLREIFGKLVAVGNDLDERGNLRSGSWLIADMAVAGT